MDLLIKFAILFRSRNKKNRSITFSRCESDIKLVRLSFAMETVPLVKGKF